MLNYISIADVSNQVYVIVESFGFKLKRSLLDK